MDDADLIVIDAIKPNRKEVDGMPFVTGPTTPHSPTFFSRSIPTNMTNTFSAVRVAILSPIRKER